PDHGRYGEWLRSLATGAEPFALSDLVCAGFVRVVTNPRLWRPATEQATALTFVDRLRRRRGCRLLAPGSGTWALFSRLVEATAARGKLLADAYLPALPIHHRSPLPPSDRPF